MGKWSLRFRAFRLYEIKPNTWFYKLRGIGSRGSRRSRKVQNSMEKGQVPIMKTGKSFEIQKVSPEPPQNQPYIRNRQSYYIPSRNRVEKLTYLPIRPKTTDTHLPLENPGKPKTNSRKKPLSTHSKLISSYVSSVNTSQEHSSSVLFSEPAHETPLRHLDGVFTDELITTDYNLHIPLPPIVTKPIKKETNTPNLDVGNKSSKQGSFPSNGNMRKSYTFTPQTSRIKMRLNSPKLAKKRLGEKKGLGDSFVMVKLSSDPQSDFRESMLEIIFQNNLWASKDLEELLFCYLYLNSDEYHHLIVKAFKKIWFDLTFMNLEYKLKIKA